MFGPIRAAYIGFKKSRYKDLNHTSKGGKKEHRSKGHHGARMNIDLALKGDASDHQAIYEAIESKSLDVNQDEDLSS